MSGVLNDVSAKSLFFPWRAKYCRKMWLSVKQPELVIQCFLAGLGLFYRIKLYTQTRFLKCMNEITHGRSNEGWESVIQNSTSFLHLLRLYIWSTLWEVFQNWSSMIISENVSVCYTSCKKHIDKSLALKIIPKKTKNIFKQQSWTMPSALSKKRCSLMFLEVARGCCRLAPHIRRWLPLHITFPIPTLPSKVVTNTGWLPFEVSVFHRIFVGRNTQGSIVVAIL